MVFPLSLLLALGPGAELRWHAPAECPQQAEVQADVDALLSDGAAERALRVDATVETRPNGRYRLRVELAGDGVDESRELSAQGCEELAEAAALLIALAADPFALPVEPPQEVRESKRTLRPRVSLRAQRPTSITTATASPDPAADAVLPAGPGATPLRVMSSDPRPPSDASMLEADAEESGVVFGMRPTFDADWGTLPRFSTGVGLNLSLSWNLLRLELRGGYRFAQNAYLEEDPSVVGRFDHWAVGPAACIDPKAGSFSFPLCAGVEGGAIHMTSEGLVNDADDELWIAARVDAAAAWNPTETIGLVLGVSGIVPAVRPRFRIEEDPRTQRATETSEAVLHAANYVSVRPTAGIEVSLP